MSAVRTTVASGERKDSLFDGLWFSDFLSPIDGMNRTFAFIAGTTALGPDRTSKKVKVRPRKHAGAHSRFR